MIDKRYPIIWIFCGLIFLLNSGHLIQQGTYENIFLVLTDNILSGKGYTLEQYGNAPMLYPLWGYVIMLLPGVGMGLADIWILAFQLILCMISIKLFYTAFEISPRLWQLPLLLPIPAIMSTKMPDAVVVFLILWVVYLFKETSHRRKYSYYFLIGLAFGIIFNLRSEYLLMLPLLIIVKIIYDRDKVESIKQTSVALLISMIMILPWGIRAYQHTGEFKITATNGGFVNYISLGQLPNNSWGISPSDSTGLALSNSRGYYNPFSIEADDYFKDRFMQAIADDPSEYFLKCTFNFKESLLGGVYTGEYANIAIGKNQRMLIDNDLAKKSSKLEQLMYLIESSSTESILILAEKLIQIFSRLILLVLILISIYGILTKKIRISAFTLIILAFIVNKLLVISLIQYEYRHINSIYPLLLGLAIHIYNSYQNDKKRIAQ